MIRQLITMHSPDPNDTDEQTEEAFELISMTLDNQQNQIAWSNRKCAICGSNSIGVNFGAPTCAPCKAFFRRNARRREILESPCHHHNMMISKMNSSDNAVRHSKIRRCSSCRLRRCFDMGMKEELVRTDEENSRHKQLVNLNRQRREASRQRHQEKQLCIPQCVVNNSELLCDIDWRHIANIVSAFDTYCLKTYTQQRVTMFTSYEDRYMPIKYQTTLPASLTVSLISFLRSLPAFHYLSSANRIYLCKNNLRPLIFPNMFEVNQSCFSEPWQTARDKAIMELMCGPELFERFVCTEKLAEKLLIADPVITRLWIVVLFFSSPLSCFYDINVSLKITRKQSAITEIQSAYVTLLWNYLLHRHGSSRAVHIFSNLIHVYLKMKGVGSDIGAQVRTRTDLLVTRETLNQLTTLDIHDRCK